MISQRVNKIQPSATLEMAGKAKALIEQGLDVISMSLGEPDFDAPEFLKESALQSVNDNYSRYSPVPGFKELRVSISEKLKRDSGLNYNFDQIVVSNGAKQSIANLMLSILDPGDEVLVPAPFWVSYRDIINFVGAKPIIIPTTIETDFKVNSKMLDEYVSSKTKALIFSSPCNPSGAVYSKNELIEIANWLKDKTKIIPISDEIYEYICFEDFYSLGALGIIDDRVVTINGYSKGFAVTGWRLGYLAAPKEIANACIKVQGQFTSGANSIVQIAAIEANKRGARAVSYMKEEFKKRRDVLINKMKELLPEVKVSEPKGAFYLFPDFSYYFKFKETKDSLALSDYLLSEAMVALTPGVAFGAPNNMRLSYALSEERIVEAVERISEALGKL